MAAMDIIFVLGDKLPTYYDAAISIWSVCHSKEGKKKSKAVNAYYRALSEVWIKAFGKDHVTSRTTILKRLDGIVKKYYNEVYIAKLIEKLQNKKLKQLK